MCNELLKNAFRFHFYDICGSFYTLRRNSAHSNFYFAYNLILKGTRCATNCLKMHFVSIFAAFAKEIYTLSCNFPHLELRFAYN